MTFTLYMSVSSHWLFSLLLQQRQLFTAAVSIPYFVYQRLTLVFACMWGLFFLYDEINKNKKEEVALYKKK